VTNLDALNDILSWPDEAYTLVWKNSSLSRQLLGHDSIANKLEQLLQTCHPSNVLEITERLGKAKKGEGPTMFDWLIEIINENKPFVRLQLE